jgi:zinc protease
VSADPGFFHDPSLFQIYAYLAPGAGHEQVEKILRDEIARIAKDGVTDAEVATAVQKISASIAYARDGTAAVAATLVEWIAAGDWTLYATYPESVKKVTAADVKRVAAKYLVEDQSTTGWFVPVVSQ